MKNEYIFKFFLTKNQSICSIKKNIYSSRLDFMTSHKVQDIINTPYAFNKTKSSICFSEHGLELQFMDNSSFRRSCNCQTSSWGTGGYLDNSPISGMWLPSEITEITRHDIVEYPGL